MFISRSGTSTVSEKRAETLPLLLLIKAAGKWSKHTGSLINLTTEEPTKDEENVMLHTDPVPV